MKTSIISFFLIFGCWLNGALTLSGQQSVTDSLEQLLQLDTLSYKTRIGVLNNLVVKTSGSNPQKMLGFAENAINLARNNSDPFNEAYNLRYIGIYHDLSNNPEEAIRFIDSALTINQRIDSISGVMACLNSKAVIYQKTANLEDGLRTNLLILELIDQQPNYSSYKSSALGNIGTLYKITADLPKAIEYYRQATAAAEEYGDERTIAVALNNLGNGLTAIDAYSEAEPVLLRALEMKERVGDLYSLTYTLQALYGMYYKWEKYDLASEYIGRALELNRQLNNTFGQATSLAQLGKSKRLQGELNEAEVLLSESLELAKEVQRKDIAIMILRELYEVKLELDRHDEAFEILQEHLEWREELFNKDKLDALQDMREKYETAQKEQQIVILEKDNEIQRAIRNGIGGGLIISVLFLIVVLVQRNRIAKEKQRSENLLLNILPAETAEELKATGTSQARHIEQVTVLFTDFKGFTALSEKLPPDELVAMINECFSVFDRITEKYGIEKIKTIGDAYMAAGGLPTPNQTHAADVVRAALEIQAFMNDFKSRRQAVNLPAFEIRIGIHTGPVVAGIVGIKKFQYDIWGDTVNTAARMESSGEVGQVNISEATYAQVKDHFECTFRGEVEAKGKGKMGMYFVASQHSTS